MIEAAQIRCVFSQPPLLILSIFLVTQRICMIITNSSGLNYKGQNSLRFFSLTHVPYRLIQYKKVFVPYI